METKYNEIYLSFSIPSLCLPNNMGVLAIELFFKGSLFREINITNDFDYVLSLW